MNWARWHKWFSLVAAIARLLDSVIQWLYDWGEDD